MILRLEKDSKKFWKRAFEYFEFKHLIQVNLFIRPRERKYHSQSKSRASTHSKKEKKFKGTLALPVACITSIEFSKSEKKKKEAGLSYLSKLLIGVKITVYIPLRGRSKIRSSHPCARARPLSFFSIISLQKERRPRCNRVLPHTIWNESWNRSVPSSTLLNSPFVYNFASFSSFLETLLHLIHIFYLLWGSFVV